MGLTVVAQLCSEETPNERLLLDKTKRLQTHVFCTYIGTMWDQSWIRSLHYEIQKCAFVLISTSHLPTLPTSRGQNAYPVQSSRKAAAACSVLGTPPFCKNPRFLASRLKNSREFRKSGTLYCSMI